MCVTSQAFYPLFAQDPEIFPPSIRGGPRSSAPGNPACTAYCVHVLVHMHTALKERRSMLAGFCRPVFIKKTLGPRPSMTRLPPASSPFLSWNGWLERGGPSSAAEVRGNFSCSCELFFFPTEESHPVFPAGCPGPDRERTTRGIICHDRLRPCKTLSRKDGRHLPSSTAAPRSGHGAPSWSPSITGGGRGPCLFAC
jgi:hypothetical protein